MYIYIYIHIYIYIYIFPLMYTGTIWVVCIVRRIRGWLVRGRNEIVLGSLLLALLEGSKDCVCSFLEYPIGLQMAQSRYYL